MLNVQFGSCLSPSMLVCVSYLLTILGSKKRIYRFPMKTEKSQREGKRKMPEKRFTEFSVLSIDPRAGISRCASEAND